MSWFKRKPTPEKRAVEAQGAYLVREREKRKTALERLLQKIEEIPIDTSVAAIGKDIGGRRP